MLKLVCVACMLALSTPLIGCRKGEMSVSIGRERIQQAVEEKFPIERELERSVLTLKDPVIDFDNEHSRIGLTTQMMLNVKGVPVAFEGSGRMTGGLRYDPSNATFYMTDLEVEAIELPMKLLADERREALADRVGATLGGAVGELPLYTMQNTSRDRAARSLIKEARVGQDRVEIVLGLLRE